MSVCVSVCLSSWFAALPKKKGSWANILHRIDSDFSGNWFPNDSQQINAERQKDKAQEKLLTTEQCAGDNFQLEIATQIVLLQQSVNALLCGAK